MSHGEQNAPMPVGASEDAARQRGEIAYLWRKLAQVDNALTAILRITNATHMGQARAHAALSQIDTLARDAQR